MNGKRKTSLQRGFKHFRYCSPWNKSDRESDIFKLQSSNNDGICITSLHINEKQIFVGKNKKQLNFWIDGNQNECSNEFMSTSQITIQNTEIISSECKG